MHFTLDQLNDILYCTRTTLKLTNPTTAFAKRINDLHEAVYAEIEKIVMEPAQEDNNINVDMQFVDFPDFQDMEFDSFLDAAEAAEAYYATDLNIEINTLDSFSYTDVNLDRVHVRWDGRSSRKFAYVYSSIGHTRMSLKQFVNMLAGCNTVKPSKSKEVKSTKMPRYVKCVEGYGMARVGEVYDTTDNLAAYRMFSLSWEEVLIKFGHLHGNKLTKKGKRFEEVKNGGRVK